MTTLVAGTVVVPRMERTFEGAVLHIVLEEVSRADAPALGVAKLQMTGVSHQTGKDTMVEFAIDNSGLSITAENNYALRAWVNLGAGGISGRADLFSTKRHAVLTHGYGTRIQIPVTSAAGLAK